MFEWTDAVGCAEGWDDRMSIDEFEGNVTSMGIVLDENEAFILIAPHIDAGREQHQGAMCIPKAMIKGEIREVEKP